MPIIKYINRLKRMDSLIRKKATGNPEEFAEKMQMNRSSLMRHLAELRQLNAPIYFDNIRQTYYYEQEVKFEIGFKKLSDDSMVNQNGGTKFFEEKIISLTI